MNYPKTEEAVISDVMANNPHAALQFKHRQFKFMVDLPDEEVLAAPAPAYQLSAPDAAQAQTTLDKFQSIMSAPLLPDNELPPLSAGYKDRLDAMELHAQLRTEQGRPV